MAVERQAQQPYSSVAEESRKFLQGLDESRRSRHG
jgi:hypothetical protein